MEAIQKFINAIFPDTELGKFWTSIIFLSAFIFIGFIIEIYTGYLYHLRLSQRIELVNNIETSEIKEGTKKELELIRSNILEEVRESKYGMDYFYSFDLLRSVSFWKVVSSGLPFLLIIIGLYLNASKEERNNLLLGGSVITVIVSVIGYMIPVIYHPSINYVLVPLGFFLIILIYGKIAEN